MFSVPTMAFLIDSAGPGEWIVLFVVILVVVGPKRLPEVARKMGRMMAMFRRAADEFKDQLMSMDQEPVDNNYRDGYTPPDSTDDYNYTPPDEADYPGNEHMVASNETDSGGGDGSGVDEAAIWEGGSSGEADSGAADVGSGAAAANRGEPGGVELGESVASVSGEGES